jgi:membrane protein
MTERTDIAEAERQASQVPGGDAQKPTEIPARGWLQIAKRGWKESKTDQVPLLAAGLAYYGFMAIFPALLACVLLYGLFADPTQVATQIGNLAKPLPAAARALIVTQLQSLSGQSTGASIGVVVAILLALWSASGGVSNMITAISTAYDEREKRGFVKKRLLALGLTLAAIVFMVVVLALVAVVPALFSAAGASGPLKWVLQALRWILIAVVVTVGLALLYRIAPDRDSPRIRWVSIGALVATALWLLASVGFSLYVTYFSNYAKTYGALAGIVILLLWLFITCYAILLGAEINAEAEQQTVKDTTKGPAEPLGGRGAVKADSMPEDSPTGPKARATPKADAKEAR